MSEIDEMETRVAELKRDLAEAENALREAKLEAAPVKVGDVLYSKKWGECRVTHVDVRWNDPWVRANSRNKNGEWSKAERHLYHDWTLTTEGTD